MASYNQGSAGRRCHSLSLGGATWKVVRARSAWHQPRSVNGSCQGLIYFNFAAVKQHVAGPLAFRYCSDAGCLPMGQLSLAGSGQGGRQGACMCVLTALRGQAAKEGNGSPGSGPHSFCLKSCFAGPELLLCFVAQC